MSRKRDEYIAALKRQLDEWNAEIDELAARTESLRGDLRERRLRHLADLERKREHARDKLIELQGAAGDSLAALQDAADRLWAELAASFEKARAAFTEHTPKGT